MVRAWLTLAVLSCLSGLPHPLRAAEEGAAPVPDGCPREVGGGSYELGEGTERRQNPETYFQRKTEGQRPRLVVLKGLPGSSKFVWSRAAEHFGWVVICLDEYRDKTIARKLLTGKQISVGRVLRTPNPLDPAHRMAVTWEASQWAKRDYEKALDAGKPILWEGVFDQPRYRVAQFVAARERGYHVDVLAFESGEVATNLFNLESRLFIGGRDLATLGLAPEAAKAKRLEVLTLMQSRLLGAPVAVRPDVHEVFGSAPSRYDVRAAEPFVAANDFVNRLDRVRVVRWESAMPPTAGVPWSVPARRVLLHPERFRATDRFRRHKRVKVVFLDADSTLRLALSDAVTANYGRDVMILPGVAERIRRWNEEGAVVWIVSNQGGVPRLVSLAQADAALRYTCEILWQAGARIDGFDFAEAGNPARKPSPEMGHILARILRETVDPEAEIDLESSLMVGDSAYTKLQARPDDEGMGTDFSDSDRLFAAAFPSRERHIRFVEPDFDEAFGWRRRFGLRRFESAAQAREILLRLAAEAGRR